ncbi:MAG: dihydropteroate synthase [Pseudomonadota bacterium]
MTHYRPISSDDQAMPPGALRLAGGWTWATHAERLSRTEPPHIVPIHEVPKATRNRLTQPRPAIANLPMDAPRIMGILNVTPDSFSDGGAHNAPDAAQARARQMATDGADILDIGGESTRPGADVVPPEEEIARTAPVIEALTGLPPVSIDTRKAAVARAALNAGAALVNDVSALAFDPNMAATVAQANVPVCLMHAQGQPKSMQRDPTYDNVLLDVYDALDASIARAEVAGIPRARIIVDPGIGFGKTLDHNLALLRGLSLFHGLGCPVLLGASRKRFIGTLTDTPVAADRMPGSVAVALHAVQQGIQIVRVHDTLATKQALTLWQASRGQ